MERLRGIMATTTKGTSQPWAREVLPDSGRCLHCPSPPCYALRLVPPSPGGHALRFPLVDDLPASLMLSGSYWLTSPRLLAGLGALL